MRTILRQRFTYMVIVSMLAVTAVACDAEESSSEPTTTEPTTTPITARQTATPVVTVRIRPTPIININISADASPVINPTAFPFTVATPSVDGCVDHGYAGKKLDKYDRDVTVYLLTDPPEDPADAKRYVAETICLLGGTWAPPGKVRVEKADYTLAQIQHWYKELQNTIWPSDIDYGIYSSSGSGRGNRIWYDVTTERVKTGLEAIIATTSVPREAVIIEVRPHYGLNEPPLNTTANIGIAISIESPAEVNLGEGIPFDIVLTNTSSQSIEVEHGTPSNANIAVFTPDGHQIWQHLPPFRVGGGQSTDIRPGGQRRFLINWSQLDEDFQAVDPGTYLVRGVMSFIHYDDGRVISEELNTEPVPLKIVSVE